MMEELVSQVEDRFAELERELADPDVITDRERYMAAGKA
jgi:protein subunit release factor A